MDSGDGSGDQGPRRSCRAEGGKLRVFTTEVIVRTGVVSLLS